ncbi:hypothetical protein Clacol_010610 [Clathrus columnatus]|uniref:Uncharacterized protein n=1 Tax=Clathrus columnatus TaxID=1419009 RepID=A0AAV5ATI1_9AGAM|nr:hypothetical protein Clacol_003253 [Clathrus columnatus]GJJ16313.1 hypothetical protein Clacol_010610 [Clathrus columnatus]
MEANSAASRHKLRLQNKLVEMGYSMEDFPGDWDAEWEEIMENPQLFSPDSSDSVYKTLEACIVREKERREADERDIRRSMRENEITSFISSLKIPPWMNRVDILQLPTIEDMIQQNDFSIPVTVKNWEMATPRISQEIDSYALYIQRKLCELMLVKVSVTDSSETNAQDELKDSVQTLNYPTSFFGCSCCSVSLLRYPSLLSHNNYSSTKVVVTQRLKFDHDATSIAKSLLTCLSLIPDNIDEAIFQCLRCQDHLVPPLSWDELVYHFVVKKYEYSKANAKWRLKPFTEDLYDDHALTGPIPIALLTKSEAETLRLKTAGKKLVKIRLPF